jgi:ABC-type dipeptide/oligopeptide/nickel transport system permease subunit
MKGFKRLFSYLINPRSGIWKFTDSSEEIEPRKVPWKGIFNPPFVLGVIIVIGMIIVVWFGPRFSSYDPFITSRSTPSYYDSVNNVMVRPPFDPSPEYPLGTDRFGNDILSLIFYGARVTMISCLYITAGRVLLGLILGGISGWTEGSSFDRLVLRMSTVISSIPLLLSAMLMILALDIHKGVWVFVVSLSVLGWTEISQLVRSEFIRIKEMLYIEAAEALGMTRFQIAIRHALPNVLSFLLSISFLEMGAVLLIMAELGFLGLYVGGGSRFRADAFSPVIIQISEIPEWGALVAQGTPYLRTYPYMILGPAMAFFFAILGLNAFGEGLRRIFDRWPFSTAFFLKKKMLLVTAAFIGISVVIFQMTNASVSYQQVAEAFHEDSVVARLEELKIYNNIARESVSNPVVDYIIQKEKEYDIDHGWSETLTSYYYYPIETTLIKPIKEPLLSVGTRGEYHYLNEFSFLAEGCAGSGYGSGQIIFLNSGISDLTIEQRKEFRGKIILTLEEVYNPDFAQAAALQGVEGILVVTQDRPPLTSQYEVPPDPEADLCTVDDIPVYRITNAVAKRITAQAREDWDLLRVQALEGKVALDLDVRVVLDLQLSEPTTVFVPNVMGFIGGYDIDHADEILVIYTSFDGLGLAEYNQEQVPEDDLAKIAVLLEIMHTWKENKVDPRRSVQFVIWGGEGVEGPYQDMLYGLFENNKLVAKVPTNMNPYMNTNPVKPAFWVEIGDLSNYPAIMAYSDQSTQFMTKVFKQAAQAAHLNIESATSYNSPVNSDLPSIYIWEDSQNTPTAIPDPENYVKKGVVINRTLIQLVRDMRE